MGTIAPLTKWVPEDDLLLKNAVEAGASLESLAKGAVQFSRRFTIQELQDRWHSLLYDLDTSEDASARIIEIEFQLSVSGPSKANKTYDSKIKQTSFGKRKSQSMQSYYYAMRKRVCSNPCTSPNLGFLVQPGSHVVELSDSGCQDQLKYHNNFQVNDHIPGSTAFDHYEHPETSYGSGHHVLPKMYAINSAAADGNIPSHANVHVGSVEDELPHEKMDKDVLKPLSSFYITKDSNDPSVPVNHNLSSEVPECSNTLDQSGYLSPPLDLPTGYGNEDNDAPHMPSIYYCKDKFTGVHSIVDIKRMHSRCFDAESGPQLDVGASETGLDNSHVVSENDMEFASPHMNSCEDDHEGADLADKPCFDDLDFIFFRSPSDAYETVIPNSDGHTVTEDLGTFLPDSVSCGESNNLPGGLNSGHDNNVCCSSSAVIMPSVSSKTSCSTDLLDGYLVCSLNTEDLEIPCNDHVLLLPFHSSDHSHGYEEKHDLGSCAMDFPLDGKLTAGKVTIGKNEQVKHLFQTSNVHRMNLELFRNYYSAETTRQVDPSVHEPNPCTSATPHVQSRLAIKEKGFISDSKRHGKCKFCSPHGGAEAAVYKTVQEGVLPSHAERISKEMRSSSPFKILPSANKEEQFSDGESDIPSFADVEAMILDMDLDLCDQGSCPFIMEASRYQSVDSKKAIIRLEQGACSFVNRAISSHGALAIFYGRRLKYFIRSAEVSIGRATHDVKVDIDLGLEGRANKVSRRQAMIKMDKDGSFFLKNTGKYSIFVNGKEVAARSCVHLNSESLVEVRAMTFIFAVNESAVRQYITKMQGSSQALNT